MLSKKWLPHEPVTAVSMGEALWLERSFWDNMANAVELGISKAFDG